MIYWQKNKNKKRGGDHITASFFYCRFAINI